MKKAAPGTPRRRCRALLGFNAGVGFPWRCRLLLSLIAEPDAAAAPAKRRRLV